ncbi:MAG TPA: hypothetical protein VGN57_16990 [Pirellulaceae bacterium]|jgi:hypothetical protein|nr:hypothetical protein [Pirellulaceae bacterium]
MTRRSPLVVAFAVFACVGVASLLWGRDPSREAIGSFEIVETEIRRVDSLTTSSLDVAYPRYAAPEGMTFLVLRWTLKPTYEKDGINEVASIPHDAVFAETASGKLPAIGTLEDTDAFFPGHAGSAAFRRGNPRETYPYSAVFVVPRDAEEVTIHAGKLRATAKLEGEILPRLDWRDSMTIEALDVSEFVDTKTEEEIYDGVSQNSYTIEHEFAVPAESLVSVKLRILPKRLIGPDKESPFGVQLTDFRLDRGALPAAAPVGKVEDGSLDRIRTPGAYGRPDDDGVMQPVEITLVFPVYDPTKRIALKFREAPVGEFDVKPASPDE